MSDGILNPKEVAALSGQAAPDLAEHLARLREKPPVGLLEHVVNCQIALALAEGAAKYGKKNYRRVGSIKASIYGDAIGRHLGQWLAGEDIDGPSGLHHLAKIGACIHVLLASIDAGTFDDDRGYQPPTHSPS